MTNTNVATVEMAPQQIVADESSALIAMIERAARDPNVDIDKMERLFQMHERASLRNSEMAFNSAMASAQAKIQPVAKNKYNEQTRSKYADLSALADAALPIISEHGLGLSFSEFESPRPNHLGVACEVTHSAGFSKRYEFHIPIDATGMQGKVNKTVTHAYGSTFSYGRRYAICGVMNIATKDDDGNGAQALVSADQIKTLRELADEKNVPAGEIMETVGCDSWTTIPAKHFNGLKRKLELAAVRS